MNRTTTHLLFFIIIFISIFRVNAQSLSNEKQHLTSVLEKIEEKFNVKFSYADANLEDKFINLPLKELTLPELLTILESTTNLYFEILDGRTIVIRDIGFNDFVKTQFLNEVLVSNYLTKGISLKNGGVTQIKPQEFSILPGLIEPDVLKTIQALPGILSVDERVSNLNVRGGTHDQNLILWDGIKIYQSGHFFGLISAFNPYLTEQVIVSKNGTSASYGDGVSSIIDMQSSSKISNKIAGGLGSNLIFADGFIKTPISKKTELQLSARRSITDVISTPTYDKYFKRIFQDSDLTNQSGATVSQNEDFYFYDFTAKVIHDISKSNQLSLNILNLYNNLNYDETTILTNITRASKSELTQSNFASSIDYSRIWNDSFSTTFQAFYSNYDLSSINSDILNSQRLIQENKVEDYGLKLHAIYKINDNVKYFGGYQFNEVSISNFEDLNSPFFKSYVKNVLQTHSIFNEVTFHSNSEKTKTRVGIRANYIEKFSDFFMEPRISFSHRFLNYFRVELLGELKNQTTSQIIDLQNDFLGIEKRRWVLANNDDVPLLRGEQISLGLHYKKNKLLMSIEGFMKNVYGITSRSQGFQNQFQYAFDTGNYKTRGIDFLVNKHFKNTSTWLSYSFSKNNYRFKNLNFHSSFPNNFDIRHNINFAFTYNLNQFKVALGLNWRSGKPYTTPHPDIPTIGENVNYDSPNNKHIKDYLRADFSTTYNFSLGKSNTAYLGFSLWNIFDRDNNLNTYYTLVDNQINRINNRALGITPNFSFRVHFN